MNQKPIAIIGFHLTVLCAITGCGTHKGENSVATPLTKQIISNPDINPAVRQAELQRMRAGQVGGRLRARLQQSGHRQPAS